MSVGVRHGVDRADDASRLGLLLDRLAADEPIEARPARRASKHLQKPSARQSLAEQVLSLLGALAALRLRLPEEVSQLGVAVAIGVLDVGFQAQRIAQALLGEPDDVVVLVGVPVTWPPSLLDIS